MDRRGTHRKISIDKNRERRDRKRQTDTVQLDRQTDRWADKQITQTAR